MSKKQKNETSAKAPVKLTRAEKKEIQAVIRKYKGDGKPHSAQASIPYEAMYQDGVCRVTPRTFSKCIEFTDISYQLAQADTKTAIFENLCDLYNYLDASIHVQFSFINRKIDPKQYAKSFEIRAQGDDFDDIRAEYSAILKDQLVSGNNGLMKRKFLTYTIEADNLKLARARLRRIETDLLGYFKSMGAVAWGLDAKARLEVMYSIFHPDGEPFPFDWKWLAPSGLSTKDFILVHAHIRDVAAIVQGAGTELVYVARIVPQHLFHSHCVPSVGSFHHRKGQKLSAVECGFLHPRFPPSGMSAINFKRNCFRVLVLWRCTALRDIPMRLAISPSAKSKTQCKIKMLCSCCGRLANASATSSLSMGKSYPCDEKT